MAIDPNTRRLIAQWNDALDPTDPLDLAQPSGQKRYVPIDCWSDPAGNSYRLRGPEDVVDELMNYIEMAALGATPASTQLLAGFRGTGKSTELNRMAATLERRDYAVVAFDAHEYLALTAAPTPEQLGLTIAAGLAERAARDLDLTAYKQRGIWERMRDFLVQDVGELEVKLPAAGAEVKAVLRETPDFADLLKRLLANKPQRLHQFVHDVVQKVADHVSPRQLILLVDGLDKYIVPRDEVVLVYRAVADVFFHQVELLRLPACHVVYVIPPYLGFLHKGLAEAYGGRLRILPSVKVRERRSLGGGAHEPGLRCLEQLASLRVDLDRLFGGMRVEALNLIASASGGHVRDLFNLLREVLRRAMSLGLPVPLHAVAGAIEAVSQDRGAFFRATIELLAAVRESENLAALDDTQIGALSSAMDEYLVLAYRNGEAWYGVHPLVEPLLDQGLAALERVRAAQLRGPQ